jgi:hypothetical protein
MIRPRSITQARGAASLAVVLVLFFIVAMVAAYTNRSLIFEQRTSANSYRSARALAAADAGIDWALAMLNGGAIDTQCQPSTAPTNDDFKTRYLTLKPDGGFAPRTWPKPAHYVNTPNDIQAQPACSADPTTGSWHCSCRKDGPPSQLNVANLTTPAFVIGFVPERERPGIVAIRARGCHVVRSGVVDATNINSLDSCHVNDMTATDTSVKGAVMADATAIVRASLGLVSALPVAPTAAVTALGNVNQTSGTLNVSNPDPATGLALMAGGTISSATNVAGPAGSTAALLAPDNELLKGIAPADFFRVALGLPPAQYRQQPATVSCPSGCSTTQLSALWAANPTRVIFIDGNVVLNSVDLGSSDAPLMLVATGDVTVSGLSTIRGVVFAGRDLLWDGGGGAKVFGAVIAGRDFQGSGNAFVTYDRDIVRRVHKSYGSFVRVPGSWNTES